jgi:DNA-directed RNA polymerase subunit beta'
MLEAGLSSRKIFGSNRRMDDFQQSTEKDHVRAYIKLEGMVLNTVLAHKNGVLLAEILGKDKDEMKAVCRYERVLDKETNALVPIEEVQSIDEFLCGAEVLHKWIDEFDLEERTGEVLQRRLVGVKIPFTLDKGDGDIALIGDWYITPDEPEPQFDIKEYIHRVFRRDIASGESVISYLLNMPNKEILYRCCLEYVSVLPLNMRPDIGERHDPLSKLYAGVISANNGLKLAKVGKLSVDEYIARYRALTKAVDLLLTTETVGSPQRKPIMKKLGGKEGHVRGHLYGKRTDYSGRSVITVNPTLSLRNVGIPKKMLTKLYRHHILKRRKDPDVTKILSRENDKKLCDQLTASSILNEVPVVIGRQPTLHRLSMQGYKPLPIESRSIQISPLAVTAFNADFDGDQMWVRVPCSDNAVKEAAQLLLTDYNMFAPDNGEVVVAPRHEILYGLNVCTRKFNNVTPKSHAFGTEQELFKALYNQDVKVYDNVTCAGQSDTAGWLAVKFCLKPYKPEKQEEITVSVIKRYVRELSLIGTDIMIDVIDRLVELGFKISELYPPAMKFLENITTEEFYRDFYEKAENALSLYERGYEEEDTFSIMFDNLYMEVEDKVKDSIVSLVGEENGVTRMAESGARGSRSNMMQIYAHKGRVQGVPKAIIENSYVDQLTPLEHFITSVGGRNGLLAKNINTSDTGYLSRQLWHACQPIVITGNDCGTKNGFAVRKSHIAMNYANKATVDEVFVNMITGRYLAEDGSLITEKRAKELCADTEDVVIRSPLACDKPCCRKCYGEDPATHKLVAVGSPVGIVAAQSIGRIGTQLSMDMFKKGGVASKGSVVSSFKKMESLVNMRHVDKTKSSNYDPVAWCDGDIKETVNPNNTKRVSIEGSRKYVLIPSSAILKKAAVKGEGMCIERGDYDMHELLDYAGVEAAQRHLIHELYSIYRDETEINLKHFEVLVLSMTMAMVFITDRTDLKPGVFHDMVHLKNGSLENTEYVLTMKGTHDVQILRPMALSAIAMERITEGLSRAVFMGLEDPLRYPLNRMLLGLGTKQGTYYSGYVDSRR